jgi:hypothetical protein
MFRNISIDSGELSNCVFNIKYAIIESNFVLKNDYMYLYTIAQLTSILDYIFGQHNQDIANS